MKKFFKSFLCIILSALFVVSLAGCSQANKMTEENVNYTVEQATLALKNFDKKSLNKYIDSKTLGYIIKLSNKYEQFEELGKAMFEGLEMNVKSVDLENKTVEVEVSNKELSEIALNFAYDLIKDKSNLDLFKTLDDEDFLNESLRRLKSNILFAKKIPEPQTVTMKIKKGKSNLVLEVDETAENAISGGALTAISNIAK